MGDSVFIKLLYKPTTKYPHKGSIYRLYVLRLSLECITAIMNDYMIAPYILG